MGAKLKIVRRGGYTDMLRAYRIFVNDVHAGNVARNGVLDLEVPSGPVKVEARIDWGRSEPLVLNAAPNQMIEVEVSNHWSPFLAIWGATFGYRNYLLLKRIGSS